MNNPMSQPYISVTPGIYNGTLISPSSTKKGTIHSVYLCCAQCSLLEDSAHGSISQCNAPVVSASVTDPWALVCMLISVWVPAWLGGVCACVSNQTHPFLYLSSMLSLYSPAQSPSSVHSSVFLCGPLFHCYYAAMYSS